MGKAHTIVMWFALVVAGCDVPHSSRRSAVEACIPLEDGTGCDGGLGSGGDGGGSGDGGVMTKSDADHTDALGDGDGNDAATDAPNDGGNGDGGDGDGGAGDGDGGAGDGDGGTGDGGAGDGGAGDGDGGVGDGGVGDGGTGGGDGGTGTGDGGTGNGENSCTQPAPQLEAFPNYNRRYELKSDDIVPPSAKTVAEIKLGAELKTEGLVSPQAAVCEAQSKANLFIYLFAKILGTEIGGSASFNAAERVCMTEKCVNPPRFSCEQPQCEAGGGGGKFAIYRGAEVDLCKAAKGVPLLGWVATQICRVAKLKASGRAGVAGHARVEMVRGTPAGTCNQCCANGNSAGLLEAGPSVLFEGKATGKIALWKFDFEVGLGAKACGSVSGKVGVRCDGSPFAEPDWAIYGAVCVESISGVGIFKIINNQVEICVPLGFFDYCFSFERCGSVGNAANACPSGSPNLE